MKYIVKIIVITILFFYPTFATAEQSIAFLDMNKLLTTSEIGKFLESELKTMHEANLKNFEKIEKDLAKKEKNIVDKKNILKQEEFEDLIIKLRSEIKTYQDSRKVKISEISQKRNEGLKIIFDNLQPILSDYSEEKLISVIVDRKNILIGKSELDVTDPIIKILDKKIKKFKFN